MIPLHNVDQHDSKYSSGCRIEWLHPDNPRHIMLGTVLRVIFRKLTFYPYRLHTFQDGIFEDETFAKLFCMAPSHLDWELNDDIPTRQPVCSSCSPCKRTQNVQSDSSHCIIIVDELVCPSFSLCDYGNLWCVIACIRLFPLKKDSNLS